ncbi:MAG: hypothetical protein JKY37_14085 [Nannocystaceae bacterium]|nr:hypothetical protein [Nannocystaceae bacterium]
MKDLEKPLQRLIELEREQAQDRADDRADDRAGGWTDVTAGTRSVQDAAAQAREGGASEADLELASALFTPLSDEFERGLTERLVGASKQNAPVVTRTAWFTGPRLAAVIAVAAAAILWFYRPSGGPDRGHSGPELIASVPAHEMWIEGTAQVRSHATDSPPRAFAGQALVFFLRPESAYKAPPHVWACIAQEGTLRPVEVVQQERHGQVVEATVAIPSDLAAGRWELVAFISHDAVAEDACAVAATKSIVIERRPFIVQ